MPTLQQISMGTFVVLFMINMGLISADSSGTFGEETIFPGVGGDLNYTAIQSKMGETRPEDETTGEACDWWNLLCHGQTVAAAASNFSQWLGMATGTVLFFIGYLPQLITGYHFVLMHIADIIEPSGIAIHLLLQGISGVLLIITFYGLWGFIRAIASLVPGVG